jgi:hypothetical protein
LLRTAPRGHSGDLVPWSYFTASHTSKFCTSTSLTNFWQKISVTIGATAFTILTETSTSRLRVKTIAIGNALQNGLFVRIWLHRHHPNLSDVFNI